MFQAHSSKTWACGALFFFAVVVTFSMIVVPGVAAADKPKGEILIWGWPAADKAFEAILPGFNEQYPDIKVKWEMIPGAAGGTRDALSTALAAGEGLSHQPHGAGCRLM